MLETLQTLGICVGSVALVVIAFELFMIAGAFAPDYDGLDESEIQAAIDAHFDPPPKRGRRK